MGFDLCFSPFRPSLNMPLMAMSRHSAMAMSEITKATLSIICTSYGSYFTKEV